jgi:chemotaxis protein histidine kinase CheA
MSDFDLHFFQLPNFLQAEVHTTAGVTTGLPYDQIIARYRSATEHLIAVKRATYQPVIGGPLTKAQVDETMSFVSTPGYDFSKAIYYQLMLAQIGYESIRFLTVFNNFLISFQAQLNEAARQLAQRQAQEAAQRLAQQQAEEAARVLAQRQAEEAARLLAQQQAEAAARLLAQRQVEEAARLLAQRQAEEAARLLAQQQTEEAARQLAQRLAEEAQLAQRQAEEAALLVIRPQVEEAAIQQILEHAEAEALKEAASVDHNVTAHELGAPVQFVPGPLAFAELDDAAAKLESDVRTAIADFTHATSFDSGISATDAFSAMLYAFKQTGVDVQAAYEGRKP